MYAQLLRASHNYVYNKALTYLNLRKVFLNYFLITYQISNKKLINIACFKNSLENSLFHFNQIAKARVFELDSTEQNPVVAWYFVWLVDKNRASVNYVILLKLYIILIFDKWQKNGIYMCEDDMTFVVKMEQKRSAES